MRMRMTTRIFFYSGLGTAEVVYRGHGTADWSSQVKEAVDMMEVSRYLVDAGENWESIMSRVDAGLSRLLAWKKEKGGERSRG